MVGLPGRAVAEEVWRAKGREYGLSREEVVDGARCERLPGRGGEVEDWVLHVQVYGRGRRCCGGGREAGGEDGCEGDGRMEAEDEGVLELMGSEGEMAAASDEVEMKSVAGSDVRERTMETRAKRMREDEEDGVAEGRDARRKKCESSESEAERKE